MSQRGPLRRTVTGFVSKAVIRRLDNYSQTESFVVHTWKKPGPIPRYVQEHAEDFEIGQVTVVIPRKRK